MNGKKVRMGVSLEFYGWLSFSIESSLNYAFLLVLFDWAPMSKDFKSITPIPNGSQMVDIILSKTQRKTPTVVRPG